MLTIKGSIATCDYGDLLQEGKDEFYLGLSYEILNNLINRDISILETAAPSGRNIVLDINGVRSGRFLGLCQVRMIGAGKIKGKKILKGTATDYYFTNWSLPIEDFNIA